MGADANADVDVDADIDVDMDVDADYLKVAITGNTMSAAPAEFIAAQDAAPRMRRGSEVYLAERELNLVASNYGVHTVENILKPCRLRKAWR